MHWRLSGDGPLVEVLPDGQTVAQVMLELGQGEGRISFEQFRSYIVKGASDAYLVFLINRAGILENLGSNMGQKSVLNQLFNPFRALGRVRNGFAVYFWSRLSPSKLRTASKWSQNPFVYP